MKLEVKVPGDGIEADIEVFDANGKKLDIKLGRIVVTPYYFDPAGCPAALYIRTLDKKEEEISRGVVQLPGSSGRARIYDRTERVDPKYYRDKAEGDEPTEENTR